MLFVIYWRDSMHFISFGIAKTLKAFRRVSKFLSFASYLFGEFDIIQGNARSFLEPLCEGGKNEHQEKAQGGGPK